MLQSVALVASFLGASCAFFGPTARDHSRILATSTVTQEQALDAFRSVHTIATSLRCVNCHAKDDRPHQFDGKLRQFHAMNVQRGLKNLGQSCQTCHQDHNPDQEHLPPGAPDWDMPLANKGYEADITPHDLCLLWLGKGNDALSNAFESGPKKGLARTPEEILEHVTAPGTLVSWAFDPGPGRIPAPGTQEELIEKVSTWVSGGAPCPEK
jgi:hypothetical protein